MIMALLLQRSLMKRAGNKHDVYLLLFLHINWSSDLHYDSETDHRLYLRRRGFK